MGFVIDKWWLIIYLSVLLVLGRPASWVSPVSLTLYNYIPVRMYYHLNPMPRFIQTWNGNIIKLRNRHYLLKRNSFNDIVTLKMFLLCPLWSDYVIGRKLVETDRDVMFWSHYCPLSHIDNPICLNQVHQKKSSSMDKMRTFHPRGHFRDSQKRVLCCGIILISWPCQSDHWCLKTLLLYCISSVYNWLFKAPQDGQVSM